MKKIKVSFQHIFTVLIFAVILQIASNLNVKAAGVLPPLLDINFPTSNSTVTNNFLVGGWAINSSGVKEVNVLIDGIVFGKATLGGYTPALNSVYQSYPNVANSGYVYTVDMSKINDGNHVILVQAVGKDGTKSEKSVSITSKKKELLPPLMDINFPASYSTATNNFLIGGWAINSSGIKEVDVLIDGIAFGKATLGGYTPALKDVFPNYPNVANSGYVNTVDISKLNNGNHQILVQAIGVDGTKSEKSISVFTKKYEQPLMDINFPAPNSTVKNNFLVGGWALNSSGVKEVNVLIDGASFGKATLGGYTPVLKDVFPSYPNSVNAGYLLNVDLSNLNNGTHKILVQAIGNDGVKSEKSIDVLLQNNSPYMDINTPLEGSDFKTNINIGGWAVNASGVKEVNILVDDNPVGNAILGGYTPVLKNVYAQYQNAEYSGYQYVLDINSISTGIHKITVQTVGNDGSKLSKQINILKDDIKFVYSDYNSTIGNMVNIQVGVGGQTDITGTWASATQDDIEKYVNPEYFQDDYGKYQFLKLNFTYGVSADDLNKLLVGKGVLEGKGQVFLNAAKTYDLSPIYLVSHALLETSNGTSVLANGVLVSQTNKLAIVKDANGNSSVVTSTNPINVTPKIAYNIFGIHAYDYKPIELKSPVVYGSEYAYSQNWFTIDDAIMNGASWIASWYIHNTTNNQDTLYKMRWNPQNPGTHQYASDVAWAYKQIVNLKTLADQCPNAALVFDMPRYLDATLIGKTIVIDPGHNYGGDDGAYSTLGGTTYIERDLNMQMALKLKVELEKLGATVVLTRQETDMSTDALKTSLQNRVDIANNANADLFISLHHDSSTSTAATGISTHYSTYKPGIDTSGVIIGNDPNGGYTGVNIDSTPSNAAIISRDLATKLADGLSSALGYTNRLAHDHNLFVTVNTNMPAVLIEEGFISNQAEAQKCADPAQQTLKAQNIAKIINDYYLANKL